METRFRGVFLGFLLLLSVSGLKPLMAAEVVTDEQDSVLIEPQIERSQFDESLIDTEDFELMLAFGYLSIEDFGVNALLAFKLNYYVNEDVFVQVALAESEGSETSYEVLSGGAPLLTDDERQLSYYNISIGYNLLPGEAFLGDSVAYNTAFYLSAGIGNTDFAGDDRFTLNYGAGYRFLLTDEFALYTDFRNHVFDMDVFGVQKATNNLEFTLGISWFF